MAPKVCWRQWPKQVPPAVQQRCITHKVRGIEPKLSFAQLPDKYKNGKALTHSEAKELLRFQIKQDAYAIYDAPSHPEALRKLQAFNDKWQSLEPVSYTHLTLPTSDLV